MNDTVTISENLTVKDLVQPPDSTSFLKFRTPTRVVLTLTADGKLERGDGMSDDEMTKGVFDTLCTIFPCYVAKQAERIKELERELDAAEVAHKETP